MLVYQRVTPKQLLAKTHGFRFSIFSAEPIRAFMINMPRHVVLHPSKFEYKSEARWLGDTGVKTFWRTRAGCQDVRTIRRNCRRNVPWFLVWNLPGSHQNLKNPGLSLSPSGCQVQYNQNKGNLNLYIYVPVTTSTISISLYDHHDWPLGILCWLRELSTWFSCDLA